MSSLLPFISNDFEVLSGENYIRYMCYGKDNSPAAIDNVIKASTNFELKDIVNKLANISMNKIANKQNLTEKEYGYLIYRIALNEGDFLDAKNYYKLYVGLYHELSSNQNFGSFAENYLNEKIKNSGIADKYFPEEDTDNKSIRR